MDVSAVDRHAGARRPAQEQRERLQTREGLVVLAADEPGVQPERDVVQEDAVVDARDVDASLAPTERLERRDGIIAVEPEVAGEVVERAERNDDERHATLDRD